MLSEKYFINFKINFIDPYGYYINDIGSHDIHIEHNGNKIYTDNFVIKPEYNHLKFKIVSNSYEHSNWAFQKFLRIKNIIIDDFWIFTSPFFSNSVVFDDDYIKHMKKEGFGWELDNTVNNDCLYFKGYMEFSFDVPIVRNYYK